MAHTVIVFVQWLLAASIATALISAPTTKSTNLLQQRLYCTESTPSSGLDRSRGLLISGARSWITLAGLSVAAARRSNAAGDDTELGLSAVPQSLPPVDFKEFRLPFNHENLPLKNFLGKATIVFNLKLDDPQCINQFPAIREIYNKYAKQGLSALAFPTEQGYFEPDDDETVRAKGKEYYAFDEYPHAVVFDKIDLLGPSAHPLYAALTTRLLTPNGYGRITLNFEKFLLDANGKPLRRYPRKYSAYDMEEDVVAALEGRQLPDETPAFQKAWREAKREAVKSEYAFRYNYNYYTSPDSMYKYNPAKDSLQ